MMAETLASIDITDAPDLLRIAEEVRQSGRPRLLRRDDEPLAVISPIAAPRRRRTRRARTEADRAAFLSSAGGWVGNVDVEKFLEDVYEARDRSARPPVEL